jgi:hypothetical protein
VTAAIDHYDAFVAAMRMYRRTGLAPNRSPETWGRLWNDIGRAYARDLLSDNEYDDLLNIFHKEVP